MTLLWIILGILAVILLAGYGLFRYAFVRRRIPDPATPQGRKKGGWTKYKDAIESGVRWLDSQDVEPLQVVSYDGKRLRGRFVPCENARGTLIFFHGYRSHYLVDFSVSLPYYHQLGYNLLLCDQRAHGESQGRYITFGVKERLDVLSWVTYMSMMLGEDHPIFLTGLSMGATTVLMAADMEFPANVRGIIADCGFTSPGDILRHLIKKWSHLPVKPTAALLNVYARIFAGVDLDEWSTEEALRQTHLPVLLVHGTGDNFVPCDMSRRAYAACTGEKRLELFEGAGHGVSYLKETERYQNILKEFLDAHTEGGRYQ